MDADKLKKGMELNALIEKTEIGLERLKELKIRIKSQSQSHPEAQPKPDRYIKHYEDGVYSLSISQYDDGSGGCAELNRSLGNEELLDTIIDKVGEQLDRYQKEFEEL